MKREQRCSNPTLRKSVQRAFTRRLVGLPPEPEETPVQPQVPKTIPEPPKSPAAIRAQTWREKQKQQDPYFNRKEAERKATERTEVDRVQQIEDTLKVNASNHHNEPFVMKKAGQGVGELVTGGYDSEKVEIVTAANNQARNGRRVVPEGFGSQKIDSEVDLPPEYEDSFGPKFKNPREIRLLREFVFQVTKKSPMLVCLLCEQQIAPGDDPGENIKAGFLHLRDQHKEQFQAFLARIKRTGCMEDHEGMARRHGGGTVKVQCKRCKKILYKPSKAKPEPRSDKIEKAA
jgi:hypothetical protein